MNPILASFLYRRPRHAEGLWSGTPQKVQRTRDATRRHRSMTKPKRKAFRPTAAQRLDCETMVAAGSTPADIAAVLGISIHALQRHFASELTHGRARAKARAMATMRAASASGHVPATRFIAKQISKAEWQEAQPVADPSKPHQMPLSPSRRRTWQAMWGHRNTSWQNLVSDPTLQGIAEFRQQGPVNEVWPLDAEGNPCDKGQGVGEGGE
jgi:hypothetical protein